MPTPEQEAINIIRNEVTNWDNQPVYVTNDLPFKMQDIVRKARRNFYQKFKHEIDPITLRQKVFIPFTEWTVETALKNIDLDTKDIKLISNNLHSYTKAYVLNKIVQYYSGKIQFGKKLNDTWRNVVIDGTGFLKCWYDNDEINIELVDRLNLLYDPTVELDCSSGIIERNVLSLPEFLKYDFKNTEGIEGSTEVDRLGFGQKENTISTQVPNVEVYERYGWFPGSVFGVSDKWAYGLVVASGVMDDETARVHKVKKLEEGEHPYQDFKFKQVNNRMDGRGIPEMTFSIQAYINEIVNLRLNVSRIAQRSLWKIRGGITPQDLTNLFATGGIKMKSQTDDIELLNTGKVDQSSYNDEAQANQWGSRVTQTTQDDVVTRDKPATNALIQERSGNKAYQLIIEGLGLALEKMVKQKLIPLIKRHIKPKEIIRIVGDPVEMKKLDKDLIYPVIYKEMDRFKKKEGYYGIYGYKIEDGRIKKGKNGEFLIEKVNGEPVKRRIDTKEQLDQIVETIATDLSKSDGNRFVEIDKGLFDTDFDVKVQVSEDQLNPSIASQQLTQVMSILGSQGVPIKDTAREIFNVMGLDADRLVENIPDQVPQQGNQAPQAQAQAQGEVMPMAEGNLM